MLKGEQLEQLIAQMNKLRYFSYLFLLTETDKFSVFLLSEMNNVQAVLSQWNGQLALSSSEMSNLSSLKAVKPTTFAYLTLTQP